MRAACPVDATRYVISRHQLPRVPAVSYGSADLGVQPWLGGNDFGQLQAGLCAQLCVSGCGGFSNLRGRRRTRILSAESECLRPLHFCA